jgi:upstream activation factor subunit UAF30
LTEPVGKATNTSKDAIKDLIMERFDKVQNDTTVAAPEPAPIANGAKHDDDVSLKKRKASNGNNESDLSDVADSPPPKKAKKKVKAEAESDEAFARNLQAEINGEKRATRGGGATKKKPAAKQAKKPKKKSSSKVSAADDSDLASGSEKPEKEKKGGFHVRLPSPVRPTSSLTIFAETHEPLRAVSRDARPTRPVAAADSKADLGLCQRA